MVILSQRGDVSATQVHKGVDNQMPARKLLIPFHSWARKLLISNRNVIDKYHSRAGLDSYVAIDNLKN